MVPDVALAHAAETLLEACAAAGALEWSIALALALENSLLLAGARAAISTSGAGNTLLMVLHEPLIQQIWQRDRIILEL